MFLDETPTNIANVHTKVPLQDTSKSDMNTLRFILQVISQDQMCMFGVNSEIIIDGV